MNKKSIIKKLNSIVLILCSISCVQDGDFDTPDISINAPDIAVKNITTFAAIKSRYEQAENGGNSTVIIEDETAIYIEGYVVSSDKSGNFFKELIVQNKTDASNPQNDPRLGFKIIVNVSKLSDSYQFGQKVFIKLNGLTIGKTNGVLTIGKGDAVNVKQIQASEHKNIILRSNEIAKIEPKTTALENLTEADLNTLIQVNNMQLNRFELGNTYASESFDEFDGFRILESCDSGISITMETSTFADFKSLIIPQGNGTIIGIYSRDFRDDFSVLIINNTTNLNFNNELRCDPMELSCGIAGAFGTENLFFEDFESQKNNRLIIGNGWTNYIEAGTQGWEAWSSTATNASLGRSARFQSSSSGDIKNIGWLITPQIDLDVQDGETLRFKTSNSRADSSFMEVLYSLDWDGTEANIAKATWGVLSDAYVVKDTDAFVPWFNSGVIDLSCISGTLHIAFKYTGGGQESFDGIYELDDISIDFVP